jgi:membrane protein required for colicin V production
MLDFIGIAILIVFFIRGYMKGIIVAVFSLLGIVLGALCAFKLSGSLSHFLLNKGWVDTRWAFTISYALLFIAAVLLVRWIANLIKRSLQLIMLGWTDKLLGGLLYAFSVALVWSTFLWFAQMLHCISPSTIEDSKTYRYFIVIAPWVYEHIGAMLPFIKESLSEMKTIFDKISP